MLGLNTRTVQKPLDRGTTYTVKIRDMRTRAEVSVTSCLALKQRTSRTDLAGIRFSDFVASSGEASATVKRAGV